MRRRARKGGLLASTRRHVPCHHLGPCARSLTLPVEPSGALYVCRPALVAPLPRPSPLGVCARSAAQSKHQPRPRQPHPPSSPPAPVPGRPRRRRPRTPPRAPHAGLARLRALELRGLSGTSMAALAECLGAAGPLRLTSMLAEELESEGFLPLEQMPELQVIRGEGSEGDQG